jgi:hypothetical protein
MLKCAFNLKDFVDKVTGSYSLKNICTDEFIENLLCIHERFILHSEMLRNINEKHFSMHQNTIIFSLKKSALSYTEQELKFLCGKFSLLISECNKNRSSRNVPSHLPKMRKIQTVKCHPYDIDVEINQLNSRWNEVNISKDIIKKIESDFFNILKSYDSSFDSIFTNLKNSCYQIIKVDR